MRRTLITISVSLILCYFFVSSARALRVSPVEFNLKVAAGETGTFTLSVMNDTKVVQIYLISVADWYRNEKGDNIFFERSSPPPEVKKHSCRDWIDVSPARFEVPPNSVRNIKVSVKVPPEAKGTYWAIIFVEGAPRPTRHRGYTVMVVPRIGVKVYLTTPGAAVKKGRVTRMMLKKENPLTFSLTFENTGDCDLRPKGWVEIKNVRGETVRKIPIPSFPVLPGAKRVLEIKDKEKSPLSPGWYQALGIIDYGGENLVAGQVVFRIKK